MEWDFFFRQLEAGINIDETCFYFADDADKNEHYLGYLPNMKSLIGWDIVILKTGVNLNAQKN